MPHAKLGLFCVVKIIFFRKNVIVLFFFRNKISKWRSFEIRAIFDLRFTFFSHQVTKIPSAHISLINALNNSYSKIKKAKSSVD